MGLESEFFSEYLLHLTDLYPHRKNNEGSDYECS